MGVEPRNETVIGAAPDAVWSALVDVSSWLEWNPTLTSADGLLGEGELVLMMLVLSRRRVRINQHLNSVDAPQLPPGVGKAIEFVGMTSKPLQPGRN